MFRRTARNFSTHKYILFGQLISCFVGVDSWKILLSPRTICCQCMQRYPVTIGCDGIDGVPFETDILGKILASVAYKGNKSCYTDRDA